MTPEQLKSSILQYAIQGKLVEQRPEEGTGEELFAQIQEEKKRLIAEKKIKKEKPLPEITEDEKPFDIPESWIWVRLSQIWSILNGDRGKNYPAKSTLSKTGIPFISAINLNGKTVVEDENLLCLSQIQYDKLVNGKLQKNDVVVCIRGSLGKHGVYPFDQGAIASSLVILRNYFFNICDDEFLLLYLDSPLFFSEIKKYDNGTAQPNLAAKSLEQFLIPLPPLYEQKRIVAKIEELLPLVDRYAVAYEKLEQFSAKFPEDMKKSILQYAIQGKLVEQRPEEGTGEELYQQIQVYKQELIKDGKLKKTRALEPISEVAIPFDFPPSWKVCYIDDIAFVTKLAGFEYTKYIADNLVTDGIPLFKGKNVQNGKLVLSFESYIPESISDELPRSQIAKKCLLTPYVGTIGNIAIFDGSFKAHLGSNVGKIELLNSDIQTFVLEEYVLWYLKSTYGYAELTKHKKATAQESISIDAIRNVIIAIPPLEEQYRIVAKIEELLPLCERLRK